MGKRRHRERQRSRSRERKRRKYDSISRSFRSGSRRDSVARYRQGKTEREGNRYHSSANSRHGRDLSTSRAGTYYSAHSHPDSYVGSEERSSSETMSTQVSSQGGSTPSPRSGRLLPNRGGRPPSPVDIMINNEEEPSRQQAGERSPLEGETIIINNDVVLPEDTLQALGEQQQGTEKVLQLHPVIKNRWKSILANGLDKAEKVILLDKHLPPGNLATLKAPIVNDEVLKAIPPNTQNKDKFQQNNQNQLGRGITALGAGINILLTNNDIDKNSVLTLLSESGKILTDVHFHMSLTRRALITPTVNKTIGDISKTAPVEELLFGADLTERIKMAKAVEKSIGDIRQKPETSSRTVKTSGMLRAGTSTGSSFRKNLNSRGPSVFRREPRQQRGQHLQQLGQKASNYQKFQRKYK